MLETGENTWLVRYYDTKKMTVFRDRIGRKKNQQQKKNTNENKKHKKWHFSGCLCPRLVCEKKRSFENSEVIFCGLYTILVNASARSETVFFSRLLVRLILYVSLIISFFFIVQLFMICRHSETVWLS